MFGLPQEHSVEPPFREVCRRASKIQLRREPPVLQVDERATTGGEVKMSAHEDKDSLLGAIEHLRHSPHEVMTIDVPYHTRLISVTPTL